MKKWNRIPVLVFCAVFFVSAAGSTVIASESDSQPIVQKDKKTITQKKTVVVSEPDTRQITEAADFEGVITDSGYKYKLEDISYEVSDTEYLEKLVKETRTSRGHRPSEKMMIDGLEYRLVLSEPEVKKVADEKIQHVNAYTDYKYSVTEKDVPKTKTVAVINERTGEEENVECVFTELKENGSIVSTETLTVTFSGYGAGCYVWNGYEIKDDGSGNVPLKEIENKIFQSAGVPSGSTVSEIMWSGEPYEENGEIRRQAQATVRISKPCYRAFYEGDLQLPDVTEIVYVNRYEADDISGLKRCTIDVTASYVRSGLSLSLGTAVILGIGTVLMIGGFLVILFVLKRRKELTEPIIIKKKRAEK